MINFEKQNIISQVLLCIAAIISFIIYQQLVDKLLDQNIQLGKLSYIASLLFPTILFLSVVVLLSTQRIQNILMGGQVGVVFIIVGIFALASLYVYYLFISLPSSDSIASFGSWVIAFHVFGFLLLLSGLLIFKTTRIFIESNSILGKLAIVLVVLICLLYLALNKSSSLLSNNNTSEILIIKIALIFLTITSLVVLMSLLNRIGLDWLLSVTALVVLGLFLGLTSMGLRLLAIVSLEGFFLAPLLFVVSTSILLIPWKVVRYLRSYLL